MKIKIGGSVSILKSFNVCFAGLHCQLKDFSEFCFLFCFLPFLQIKQVAVGSVPVIQPRSTLPTAGVFYRPDRVQLCPTYGRVKQKSNCTYQSESKRQTVIWYSKNQAE